MKAKTSRLGRAALIWIDRISDLSNDMKTTLEISDPLLEAAKLAARRQGTTLRALIERGLRLALDEQKSRTDFTLRDASFGGQGLQPNAAAAPFFELRKSSYGGRSR